ncbi:aminomethyltransferase [Stutzerimonas stutzeri]|uniref:Aminomethyltransferase n=1 Tax=Stutzerimonas stutzeri TaxID=316 RepID=A0A2N8T718_STUST|nr:aminomethyltransferase family protein [Stutzerimonas stutzeri]MCQ4323484.1 aminomethyltransferase family protein [Stutzerimonas stutzeri]PNG10472.1 aminomethyltransferase [Stutzerimonas stutzeri]
MQQPMISRPHEPALFARAPGLERHRVAPGGLTVVALEPGDHLEVIDLEGDQLAELLAFAADGREALAALGLHAQPGADFIARLLAGGSAEAAHVRLGLARRDIDCRQLPPAARLWQAATPAGFARSLTAEATLLVIVAAPGGPVPVDSQLRASELRLTIRRANPRRLLTPALPEPLGELVDEFTIHPGSARDYEVGAGQYIQVIDVAGRQCSDFVAFDRRGLDAGREIDLDPTVTRTLNGNAYPGPGLFSRFFDRDMQPMLEVVRDTVGRHDTFALACTARYYESQGYFGHANCSDNISRVLHPYGVRGRPGWPAINFFFNTAVDAHQQLTLDEPWSRPGDYVLLRAMTELVCASSSCPDDIDPANGWQPTDIHIRVYSDKERFSIAMANRKTPDADPVLTRESGFHPGTSALTRHFVDYRGWWTPTHFDGYGAIEEYHGCRERVAVMDLSALRKFEVIGPDAEALLNYCLTRDVRKLAVGQVVYSAMCYEHGGMLDDGTLLRLGPDTFRWICGEDYAGVWLREQAERLGMKVWVKSASEQIHNIAVQGPLSRELLARMIWTPGTQPPLDELGWFRFLVGRLDDYNGCPLMVSRTGYTGELGYEIWCHPDDAMRVWRRLWQLGEPLGLVPLGLHALDMLRIEAGLIFAGYEFSDQTDPFEAGIGFCVPLKSKQDDFIGREALLRRKEHPLQRLVGLELEGNEIAHHGNCVHAGRAQVGVITSATRSPLLGRNIALCRLDVAYCQPGTRLEIGKLDGQQKRIGATVVAGTVAYDPDKSRVRA